jgi:hypothetical protein
MFGERNYGRSSGVDTCCDLCELDDAYCFVENTVSGALGSAAGKRSHPARKHLGVVAAMATTVIGNERPHCRQVEWTSSMQSGHNRYCASVPYAFFSRSTYSLGECMIFLTMSATSCPLANEIGRRDFFAAAA